MHGSDFSSSESLERAINQAVDALLARQRPDGSWSGDNFAGPAYTAMLLATEGYLKTLSAHDAEQGLRWLRTTQLDDGSFPDYPHAKGGSLSTTALVYAGMLAAGADPTDSAMVKSKDFIAAGGGFEKADQQTWIYLALSGLINPAKFGRPLLFFKLIPGVQRLLGCRFGIEVTISANQVPLIVRALQSGGEPPSPWLHPIRALEGYQVLKYLSVRQNPAGNWAGLLMPTLWGLLCLHFLGVPRSDPRFRNGLRYLDHWKVYDQEGMHVVPYMSEVWNTALITRILLRGGLSSAHDAMTRGLGYLLEQQSVQPAPADWQNPAPGAPRTGGWAYEADNELCSDADTTAAVLGALRAAIDHGGSAALEDNCRRGLGWLLGMQNPCGGWPAFTHGLKSKPPGPMFTRPLPALQFNPLAMLRLWLHPPLELGDPAWADLTGRVLSGLAASGYTEDNPDVRAAMDFLKAQLDDNQGWWGRWEVNYLLSSAYVLIGLKAVGENMRADYARRVTRWIVSKQNADGGWGEGIDSYTDAALAGIGPSQPAITGKVLVALMAAGESDSPAVRRGVEYLLERQNAEGLWESRQPLGVMVPPNAFYSNPNYNQCGPLEALLIYRAGIGQPGKAESLSIWRTVTG